MRRTLLISLALLAEAVFTSSHALADSTPGILYSWPTAGGPSGIVVRPTGTYVVNRYGQNVQQFSGRGELLAQWGTGGTGDGEFQFPQGMAIDAAGIVYVSDRDNNRIQRFSSTGSYLGQWGSQGSGDGQFQSPLGVAVGPDGSVYVADPGNHRIQRFTGTGGYLGQWGVFGSGPGELLGPNGIAVDPDGIVYVTDNYSARILKYTGTGVFLAEWGSYGGGDGELASPEGIAVDGDSLYVADTRNDRIQLFTRGGVFLSAWGSTGPRPGRLSSPTAVAVGDSGRVYVTDFNNSRVQVYGRHDPSVLRVPADFLSIQAAIAAAGPGDTVVVAPGTYFENVDFRGKPLILASEFVHGGGATTIAATVIDGRGLASVVNFHNDEDTTCALIGFTLRNGSAYNGGGVYCSGAGPRLEHLIVRDNTAGFGGGGIGIQYGAYPTILDCTITANRAPHGGGIWGGGFFGAPGHRCNIYNNVATPDFTSDPCGLGADLEWVGATVYVDTFTVLNPDEAQVNPPSGTTLEILHGYYPPLVAADVFVSPRGDNANDGLTPATALRNASFALLRAQAGPGSPMTIHLLPGVYSASLTGEKPLHGRSFVSLVGEDSATTVIDGDASQCLLYCLDDTSFTISRITFRNAKPLHFVRSNPTITLCNIVGNQAQSTGIVGVGGIYCDDHSPVSITRCTIAGNLGSGIVLLEGSNALIEGNLIAGNNGNEIDIRNSNAVIRENRITGDSTGGRGIESFASNVEIRHNRIEHHRSGGIGCFGGTPRILGNEITENSGPGVFCGTEGATIDSNLIARNHITTFEARGAGLYCTAAANWTITITRNRFLGNVATSEADFVDGKAQGGGIFIDGQGVVIGGSAGNGNVFRDNRAQTGADLYAKNTYGAIINAEWNSFHVYPATPHYVSALASFDLANGTGDLAPITQDVYVAPTGNDANAGTSSSTPLKTVQFALARLLPTTDQPLTIHVGDGVYAPDGNGDAFPLVMTPYVSLRGNGPGRSVLDARGSGGVILLEGANNVTISGLTIRGGQCGAGGGVSFRSAMACSLMNNVISGNGAFLGGGIYCAARSNPVIAGNLITGNQTRDTRYFARLGGGMFANDGARPILIHNVIASNSALDAGGGVVCWNESHTTFTNNTIVGNTSAASGGGISVFNSNVVVVNSIVRDNAAPSGSQLDGPTLSVTYSDVGGGWVGEGNINADPLFDGGTGRYNLTTGSPCIDAGSSASEFSDPEDPARPGFALYPSLGTLRNDMGAYGGPGRLLIAPAPAANRPPDCSAAAASVPVLRKTSHHDLQLETIVGVSDPDGDPVTITITGVTQDEPILARRGHDDDDDDEGEDGHDDLVASIAPGTGMEAVPTMSASTPAVGSGVGGSFGHGRQDRECPDAFLVGTGQVQLRRERLKKGNGRVYAISFAARDSAGGECSSMVRVCVPRKRHSGSCIDDGQTVNSLGPCPRLAASVENLPVDGIALAPRSAKGSQVTLDYAVPEENDVQVTVFDILGRRLATLENSRRPAGWYVATWSTAGVPSGMYYARLRVGNLAITKAVLVLR